MINQEGSFIQFFYAVRLYVVLLYLFMGRIIEVSKKISREDLDKELSKLTKKRKPIDLDKYTGKIDFGRWLKVSV